MACALQPLAAIFRGERLDLTFTNEGATDLDTWTVIFTLAAKNDAAIKLLEIEASALTGDIGWFVPLTSANTDLEPGGYAWDLWRTDEGLEQLLARGTLRIRGDARFPIAV